MPVDEDKAVTITVPSDDGEKKEKKTNESGIEIKPMDEEMSPEDRALLEGLELAVERTKDVDAAIQKAALEHLKKEIRSSTSSMTSVPKPLKYLRPHYQTLKDIYQNHISVDNKKNLADILSVLAMTMAKEGSRESLGFKLEGHLDELGSWGHEYVRSLSGEIGEEYNSRFVENDNDEPKMDDLMVLIDQIVPFHLGHNAEPEAVDLLIEVQKLSKLLDQESIDEKNYQRICLYLLRLADFTPDPDDLREVFSVTFQIYKKQNKFTDALIVAIKMENVVGYDENCVHIQNLFNECDDQVLKKQMALIIARSHSSFTYEEDDELNELMGNNILHENFIALGRDLDVLEPKTPEDIYKSHLAETGGFRMRTNANQPVDSARANLASNFVNAFVNAGFCVDNLITPDDSQWVFKNKDHGIMSAAASLGMIMLWNVEEGLTVIDKYLYTNQEYAKAGATLAVGIISSKIKNDSDPALALLAEHFDSNSNSPEMVRIAACVGLGIAYAGTAREDVMELLVPIVSNTEFSNITEASLAALSLGQIFVGTCNEDVGTVLVQRLMESSDIELDQTMPRFICLGIALLFLGKTERCEAMLQAVRTIDHKIAHYAEIIIETCANCATGNVLQVQKLMHICAEHSTDDIDRQMAAVLGISLITMGEQVGTEMALRAFDHLLHYGEISIRRGVPLALALLYISNPEVHVIDQLSRLTHDSDANVSTNAIIALGLVGAGTNNSRIAGLLRQLSEFYNREACQLFAVRIAQGLLHMAKGLITLNPFHSDRLLMSHVSVGAILTILHSCFDFNNIIFDKYHYLLYYIVGAINPRMFVTVDESLTWLPVTTRVGQAVETVGQAGRPKTITGFQTYTTPVLLGAKERAELAVDEYIPVSNILEGIVILKPNPEYKVNEKTG